MKQTVESQQAKRKYFYDEGIARERQFVVGENAVVRNVRGGKEKWLPGDVLADHLIISKTKVKYRGDSLAVDAPGLPN